MDAVKRGLIIAGAIAGALVAGAYIGSRGPAQEAQQLKDRVSRISVKSSVLAADLIVARGTISELERIRDADRESIRELEQANRAAVGLLEEQRRVIGELEEANRIAGSTSSELTEGLVGAAEAVDEIIKIVKAGKD